MCNTHPHARAYMNKPPLEKGTADTPLLFLHIKLPP